MNTCEPSVLLRAVYIKHYRLTISTVRISPIVVGIDLCVEGKFGKQKPSHGACYPAVIVALQVAVLIWQERSNSLQFIHDILEYIAAIALSYIGRLLC